MDPEPHVFVHDPHDPQLSQVQLTRNHSILTNLGSVKGSKYEEVQSDNI